MGMLLALLMSPAAHAADLDNDGIPDAFEDQLLQRFAPVIKIDQVNTTPSEFRAIPVSPKNDASQSSSSAMESGAGPSTQATRTSLGRSQ